MMGKRDNSELATDQIIRAINERVPMMAGLEHRTLVVEARVRTTEDMVTRWMSELGEQYRCECEFMFASGRFIDF